MVAEREGQLGKLIKTSVRSISSCAGINAAAAALGKLAQEIDVIPTATIQKGSREITISSLKGCVSRLKSCVEHLGTYMRICFLAFAPVALEE